MNNSRITVQVTVEADTGKVWDYYNNPNHIIHWNFADLSWHCPKAENDMKVGGTYKARMEAKDGSAGFDFEAVYTDIKDGEEFTYEFGERAATIQFNDQGGKTEVVVTFDPETENPIEIQKGGWQAILNNFKTYTDNN